MNKKNTNITTENKTIKDTNKISLDISIETIKLELENKFLTFPLRFHCGITKLLEVNFLII